MLYDDEVSSQDELGTDEVPEEDERLDLSDEPSQYDDDADESEEDYMSAIMNPYGIEEEYSR